MKIVVYSILGLFFSLSAAEADPLYGLWKTIPDGSGNFGHIKIQDCDGTICGLLIKSFDADGKSVKSDSIDKRIIWNITPEGGGKYGGGKIWALDRDKTYAAKLQLEGDKLKVSGCVFVICRDGGTWIRVK